MPDQPSQALVEALLGDAPKEERGLLLPLMRRGNDLSPAVPGFIHGPYEAAAKFMSGGFRPGTQDEQGVKNAANAAAAFAGSTGARAGGEAMQSLGQQLAEDRTLDALKYHLRQISHDGGWPSRLGKAAFAASPIAAEAAFAPFQSAAAVPWMMGAAGATTAAGGYAFLRPHYDMLMRKRDYLRDMDKRQVERALEASGKE